MTREERKFAAMLALFARMEEKAQEKQAPKSAPSTPLPKEVTESRIRNIDHSNQAFQSPASGTSTPAAKAARAQKEKYVSKME